MSRKPPKPLTHKAKPLKLTKQDLKDLTPAKGKADGVKGGYFNSSAAAGRCACG
jgi:hypothetical protein